MTEKDKELLLRDLCARLPYNPNCLCKWTKEAPNGTEGCIQELSTFIIDEIEKMDNPRYNCQICDVKPYLRPMSSMTEEEKERYLFFHYRIEHFGQHDISISNYMDWLNAHHLDYRNLIEKGLALPAKEGMYNI